MNVTVRLYARQDMDLIELYKHSDFSLPAAMKTAVCNFAKREARIIPSPPPEPLEHYRVPKSIQFHIIFTEKDGEETIAFLKHVTKGMRNNCLKNLLRASLGGFCCQYYMKDFSYSQSFKDNVSSAKENKKIKKKKQSQNYPVMDKKMEKEPDMEEEDIIKILPSATPPIPPKQDVITKSVEKEEKTDVQKNAGGVDDDFDFLKSINMMMDSF